MVCISEPLTTPALCGVICAPCASPRVPVPCSCHQPPLAHLPPPSPPPHFRREAVNSQQKFSTEMLFMKFFFFFFARAALQPASCSFEFSWEESLLSCLSAGLPWQPSHNANGPDSLQPLLSQLTAVILMLLEPNLCMRRPLWERRKKKKKRLLIRTSCSLFSFLSSWEGSGKTFSMASLSAP